MIPVAMVPIEYTSVGRITPQHNAPKNIKEKRQITTVAQHRQVKAANVGIIQKVIKKMCHKRRVSNKETKKRKSSRFDCCPVPANPRASARLLLAPPTKDYK
jgi:hypothetical protein